MSETRERLGLQAVRDKAGQPVAFIAPADELDLLIEQRDGAVALLEGLLSRLVDLSNSGQLSATGFSTLLALVSEGAHRHRLELDLARVRRESFRNGVSATALGESANEGVRSLAQDTGDENEIVAVALKRLSSEQVRFPSAKVKGLLASLETLSSSKRVDASDVLKLVEGLQGE
jgi:hypothetical protein